MNQPSNKPRILRITRPYESVEDYVQSEGWTISNKRMILLDQPRFDRDTLVRFELSLQNGEKLIRAEAKVIGYQAPTPDKPGGPKVRFKRFGGTTKAFIQQVVAEHGPGPGLETVYPSARTSDPGEGPVSEAPHSLNGRLSVDPGTVIEHNVPGVERSAPMSGDLLLVDRLPALGAPDLGAVQAPVEPQQFDGVPAAPISVRSPGVRANPIALDARARERLRGLRDRQNDPTITPPHDRDALLARLRERAQSLAPAATSSEPPSASPS